jgi:3-hydroxyisobutyrate dehydrogenase-like beta-hydroxyacid dehydrogenase
MIGLGLMGEGLRRLIETGHTVAGYDIVADKLAAAVARGAHLVRPAEVARRRHRLMSLTTTPRWRRSFSATAASPRPGGSKAGARRSLDD